MVAKDIITKQPHFIPGYTGHCPQYRYRVGSTFGQLSHRLFLDPCIGHAADLVLMPTNKPPSPIQFPTRRELRIVKNRENRVDAVYKVPIVGSYKGFVPNLRSKVGKTYVAAATAGVAEFETLMEVYRCERKNLTHGDILANGRGRFNAKLGERMMRGNKYRAPLIPVIPKQGAVANEPCCYKDKPDIYSKSMVPHFLEDHDEEKFIISGYGGHVPMANACFGLSAKVLNHKALCDFTRNDRQRRRNVWCPVDRDFNNDCPKNGHFEIYHKEIGMLPGYDGHVPGGHYRLGKSYGAATKDAKGWLQKYNINLERREYCSYCNKMPE